MRDFAYLHLSIGPSWNFHNHVQDCLLLIGIEGHIVKWRNWDTILLDVDSVLESIGGGDLAGGELGHVDGCRCVCVVERRRRRARDMSSYLNCALRQCGKLRSQLQILGQGR
jgi:hypothetical protein